MKKRIFAERRKEQISTSQASVGTVWETYYYNVVNVSPMTTRDSSAAI